MTDRRKTIRPPHDPRRLVAATVVLLAMALVGPATVEAAGCGRHVAADAGSVALIDELLRVDDVTTGERPTAPRKPPCSGPQCSEGRPPASPTPSTAGPNPLREWGNLARITESPRPSASADFAPEAIVRSVRLPSRPDRPPRPFA